MTTNNPLLKITGMLNQFLLNVETFFLSGITIFLVAAIFIEVICRYFLFYSVAWAEEITRYLFIWLTFIGSAYALYYGQHTEIDVLKQAIKKSSFKNKESLLHLIHFLSIVATTIFLIAFADVFYTYMMRIWARTQTSPTMHIPMGLIYLPVFIGVVLSIFHEVCMFIDFFAMKPTSSPGSETTNEVQSTPSEGGK